MKTFPATTVIEFRYSPSFLEKLARSLSKERKDVLEFDVGNNTMFKVNDSNTMTEYLHLYTRSKPEYCVNYTAVRSRFSESSHGNYHFDDAPLHEELLVCDQGLHEIAVVESMGQGEDEYMLVLLNGFRHMPASIRSAAQKLKSETGRIDIPIDRDSVRNIVETAIKNYHRYKNK